MIGIGVITLWVLSVIKGIPIKRIRVVGIWLLLYGIGLSQRKVMMHIGVLGGLYNRDNVISNVEGYIYILSIILMLGYLGHGSLDCTNNSTNKQKVRGFYGHDTLSRSEVWTLHEQTKGGEEKGGGRKTEGWEMEVEVVLLSVTGMVLLVWSYDLITTYLAIELQSLALYMITSRSEEGMGAISGLKYYILGILSSSILLMGIVLIYQGTGTTHNEGIRMIMETREIREVTIGGYLMISGILLKLALPPFHNWAPDVYEGVVTRITSWIAVMGKISYLIYIYNVRIYDMGIMEGIIVGALIIGSVMGLTQNRVKRLLAYSTINQMGYPLMGLLTVGVISRVSFIFYNVQYWITLVNSFCILIALGGRYDIRYVSSIYRESPVLLMTLVINIYSLIGIPPLIGFFGKQMVISSSLLGGYVGLVTIAVITSVISGGWATVRLTTELPEMGLAEILARKRNWFTLSYLSTATSAYFLRNEPAQREEHSIPGKGGSGTDHPKAVSRPHLMERLEWVIRESEILVGQLNQCFKVNHEYARAPQEILKYLPQERFSISPPGEIFNISELRIFLVNKKILRSFGFAMQIQRSILLGSGKYPRSLYRGQSRPALHKKEKIGRTSNTIVEGVVVGTGEPLGWSFKPKLDTKVGQRASSTKHHGKGPKYW